ncbi:MAG: hypothetical protein ABGW84_09965 [Sphingomonadaceae bacterium]
MAAISVLLAINFQRGGRHDYATGFYWSLGNILLSAGAVIGNFGSLTGGWLAIPYLFVISSVAYFGTLGVLVTYRYPKNVRCFRCQYVSFPHETDDERSPYDDAEWQAFRKLDAECRKQRLK